MIHQTWETLLKLWWRGVPGTHVWKPDNCEETCGRIYEGICEQNCGVWGICERNCGVWGDQWGGLWAELWVWGDCRNLNCEGICERICELWRDLWAEVWRRCAVWSRTLAHPGPNHQPFATSTSHTATGTTRPATLRGPPHSHTSTSIACIFSHIHLHCLNLLTCPLTLLTHSLTQPNQSHTFTCTA